MTRGVTPTKALALLLVGGLVAGGVLALMLRRHDGDGRPMASHDAGAVSTSRAPAYGERPPVSRQQRVAVNAAVARLRAMEPVEARTSAQRPSIGKQARQQPDLYATAFAEQLLTQDFRASREAFLAWVQSESVPSNEPSVVGLTPPGLRDRLAVASLADASDGPAPIPSAQVWAVLGHRHGYTTAKVRRVITPPTWTSAVAAGEISDPGVTAREVDADVTLHTTEAGRAQTQTYSVALTMNLEGPPTRDDYGFVTAVTYRAVEGD